MSADRTQGRFEQVTVASEALRGNPLGDPHERPLWVYLPDGYEERRWPVVYERFGSLEKNPGEQNLMDALGNVFLLLL